MIADVDDGRSGIGNFVKRQSVRLEREAVADGRASLRAKSVSFTGPKLVHVSGLLCCGRTDFTHVLGLAVAVA